MRTVSVAGVEVGRGSRVVLRPRAGADIFDHAIAGRVAVVDRVDEDMEGSVQLAVVVEDDPGRDLGERRQPGHRFFFSPEEVEPLSGQAQPAARVLVAGIGNIFMGTTRSAWRWRAGSRSANCHPVWTWATSASGGWI